MPDWPVGCDILVRYGGRFRIEKLFHDLKEQGFRLEKTRLRDTQRLAQLVLCVCIAYVFALLLGEQVEGPGLRQWVERSVKQQMSLFQVGLRYLMRLLAQGYDWTELLVLRFGGFVRPVVFVEGQRRETGNSRRCARVILKFADAQGHKSFLAPLHAYRWKGERSVLPE